jgi:hypothetical protein
VGNIKISDPSGYRVLICLLTEYLVSLAWELQAAITDRSNAMKILQVLKFGAR